MTAHNDSHARRSNGPRRRANNAKINWTKRDDGPSAARKAQIAKFNLAADHGDMDEVQRLIITPIED